MPLPKEYYYAGNPLRKKIKDVVFIILGILGSLFILAGFTQDIPQIYYVIGSSLLLLTAIYFKLFYFIALELILIAGHGTILLGMGTIIPAVLPVLLSLQLFIYYLLSGLLGNIYRWIGIIGIALVSIGFSYAHLWVFFFGSLCVAIFAINNVARGKTIALIWVVLNLFFAFATGFIILQQ